MFDRPTSRYESGVATSVKCTQCHDEWDGEVTVSTTDVMGNFIANPVCLPCHNNNLNNCDDFVENAKKLFKSI